MTFVKTKRISKSGIVSHYCKSLKSGLIEDSWICISSAFALLIQFRMKYMKKILSYRKRHWERKDYLNSLFQIIMDIFVDTKQTLSGSGIPESELQCGIKQYPLNFLYSITLKSIGPSYIIN